LILITNEKTLENLKKELIRIGTTNQKDYDLLKRKGQLYSTTICRRLKLSWPTIVEEISLDAKQTINLES
jgi:hypothetical protein